jgi:hypothetical protein
MSKINQEIVQQKSLKKRTKETKNNQKGTKSNQIQEEMIKNKFDTKFININNFISNYNIYHDSRKYSKDSSNLSTSNEDLSEHDLFSSSQKHPLNNNITNFKGKASDFKTKYKTELCKFYEMTGKCKYGENCAYAHGIENLRSKVTNTTAYRTKKCIQFFETGYCPYGSRCQFQHQLKNNILNNPYDSGMNYQKILEIISKSENIRNIKKLVKKPRLDIFKEISGDNSDNNDENELFNDIKKIIDNNNHDIFV